MTEELEKEADEYATENYEQCIYDDVIGWKTDYEARKQAYLAGAEPREKQIAELEAQIKKMKCCANCKLSSSDVVDGTYCCEKKEYVQADCKCPIWQLKE